MTQLSDRNALQVDTVVLGAGIIGASAALQLARRGQKIALVDRRRPGQETSFGNAGIIQREAVSPYAFPRDVASLLRHAANRGVDVHYHASALAGLAPFLLRYWANSRSDRHAAITRSYETLIRHCLSETAALAEAAGAAALLRPTGWLKVFRTARQQEDELRDAEVLQRTFGVAVRPLDRTALRALEPHLDEALIGALHYPEPLAVIDPGGLVEAYCAQLERLGGAVLIGHAQSLREDQSRWTVDTQRHRVEARSTVVALGAWSDNVTARLGYRLPLGVKRGYHMHYDALGNAVLGRPILDVAHGYALAPTTRGLRLTTGAEFARRDAPKTPVQLARAEPLARGLFPLGARRDGEPWMGVRPCTPDMMPIIGPAPRHKGLWFAFGHAHHGLTLGAVTGRLIAEMVMGEAPFVDPAPFRADRPTLR